MDVNSGNGVSAILGSDSFEFGAGRITSVGITDGASTVNVLRSVAPIAIVSDGPTSVNVGVSGRVQGIDAEVDILSQSDFNNILIDDSQDTTGRSVMVSDTAILGLAPAPITYLQSHVGGLLIKAGTGVDTFLVTNTPWNPQLIPPTTTINTNAANDTINIQGTTGPLVIDGQGDSNGSQETINIGSLAPSLGGTLANIGGPIAIINQSTSTMTIDDSGDKNNVTGTITPTLITGFGMPSTINYSSGVYQSITVLGGGGVNTVNVLGTTSPMTIQPGTLAANVNVQALAAHAALTIAGAKSTDNIVVGSLAPSLGGTLANIQSPITITNTSPKSTLTVDDSGDSSDTTGSIDRFSVQGMGMGGAINYGAAPLIGLTVLGGTGNTTFTVAGTPAATALKTDSGAGIVNVRAVGNPLTIDAQKTTDTINAGSLAPSLGGTLAGILAPISIVITSATSALHVDDSGALVGSTGVITGKAITGFGMRPKVATDYSRNELQSLTVRSGAGTNTITVLRTSNRSTTLIGLQGAVNTLVGPNRKTTWNITGTNSGNVPTLDLSFSHFRNLTGGTAADAFVIMDGCTITGKITGGAGRNSLDYSNWTGNVVANLQTGSATSVGGGVALIQNIIDASGGGAGFDNILVGNGHNRLTGGDGRRNYLEAGGPGGTLQGGSDDDILVGGTTIYDKQTGSSTSLISIMNYWSNTTDSYATRVSNLVHGTGIPALNRTTAHNTGLGVILLGHHDSTTDLNVYYGVNVAKENTDIDTNAGELFEPI